MSADKTRQIAWGLGMAAVVGASAAAPPSPELEKAIVSSGWPVAGSTVVLTTADYVLTTGRALSRGTAEYFHENHGNAFSTPPRLPPGTYKFVDPAPGDPQPRRFSYTPRVFRPYAAFGTDWVQVPPAKTEAPASGTFKFAAPPPGYVFSSTLNAWGVPATAIAVEHEFVLDPPAADSTRALKKKVYRGLAKPLRDPRRPRRKSSGRSNRRPAGAAARSKRC